MLNFETVVEMEAGPRTTRVAAYKGWNFKIHVGYNILVDAWHTHVYATSPTGSVSRLTPVPATDQFDSQAQAFDAGFHIATAYLEDKV